jgi:SAM-dependent methyltransferase
MWKRPTSWLSYDSVAETYERAAVPWFTPLGSDLVAAMGLSAASGVLDVGTGTGLVAGLASAEVRPEGLAIGIDPSIGMLRAARSVRGITVLAAMAPGLPFRDRSFDAVLANLVLSHLPDMSAGLVDMARVLVQGGRLGASAWGPTEPVEPDDQAHGADAVVARVRDECGLPATAPAHAAPWEEELREPQRLCGLLCEAGLVSVSAQLHNYRWTFSVPDFLAGWGSHGRYLRHFAGEARLRDFQRRAEIELRKRFGDEIRSVNHVWLVTGTKP